MFKISSSYGNDPMMLQLLPSHRTKHLIFTIPRLFSDIPDTTTRSLCDLCSQRFYCFGLKIVFFTFAGRKKVKDYGVTSCVAKNVNKYNFSEGYRIFWHLCSLFMAFPLNVFFLLLLFFALPHQPDYSLSFSLSLTHSFSWRDNILQDNKLELLTNISFYAHIHSPFSQANSRNFTNKHRDSTEIHNDRAWRTLKAVYCQKLH